MSGGHAINPFIENIYRNGYYIAEDGSHVDLKSGVSQEEGLFIAAIVRDLKPRASIEIGMAKGLSTLFIADALTDQADKNHIVIDPFQITDYGGMGLYQIRQAGLDSSVTLHEALSHEALPQLLASGIKVDFAFIDGSHLFDHAFIDFFYIDLMLNIGGIVVLDDTTWPAIRQLCRYIMHNRDYNFHAYLSARRVPKDKPRNPHHLVKRVNPLLLSILKRRFGDRLPGALRRLAMIGLIGSADCIAFRKVAGTTRGMTDHHDF